MTVCIAAIFDSFGVVAASDRMLTAGDVQFEPSVPKLRFFTTSIAGLIAGDANLQAEIVGEVSDSTSDLIQKNPSQWVKVRDVAFLYKSVCDKAVGRLAEQRILSPFGLDLAEFMARQREFSESFVKDIGTELLNFDAPLIQTIIAGCDGTGAHIYTVDNESVQCHDSVGFAAIGAGQSHANSQMMAFNHTYRHGLADTLRAVFYSKKRAEIAPGVTPSTDMMVAIGLGGLSMIADKVQAELEKRYAEEKRLQAEVADTTRKEIGEFVQAILDKPSSGEQSQFPVTSTDPDTSSSLEENGPR